MGIKTPTSEVLCISQENESTGDHMFTVRRLNILWVSYAGCPATCSLLASCGLSSVGRTCNGATPEAMPLLLNGSFSR